MHNWNVVVFYDGAALVIINGKGICDVQSLLDWYAKHYAFDRKHLSGTQLHCVQCDAKLYSNGQGGLVYKEENE